MFRMYRVNAFALGISIECTFINDVKNRPKTQTIGVLTRIPKVPMKKVNTIVLRIIHFIRINRCTFEISLSILRGCLSVPSLLITPVILSLMLIAAGVLSLTCLLFFMTTIIKRSVDGTYQVDMRLDNGASNKKYEFGCPKGFWTDCAISPPRQNSRAGVVEKDVDCI